ncbi:MAG: hypothetical protein ACRDMH_15575 [Solirubrobacterales bacterium]
MTLNSDSWVAGSGAGRATANPVGLVSISFAGTGVIAWVVALVARGAASFSLKLDLGALWRSIKGHRAILETEDWPKTRSNTFVLSNQGGRT